jgi:glycosyltransferase involved in cell wall biosynthesis
VGGNPEVILDGTSGFLVPLEDPRAMALRIVQLLRDKSLADSLRTNGLKRVASSFSFSSMLKEYYRVYETA